MKTDIELQTDVQAEMSWDAALGASEIGVIVKDGVVTLTGHVQNYVQKHAAERAALRVKGVRAVALELEVKPTAPHRRTDSEIAQAAEHTLKWHALVPKDQIQVTVERGWITLRGELEWEHQRRSAEKSLRTLPGVTGVTNFITLKPQPVPANLHKRIEDALARQALREAGRIKVTVDGSRVLLSGRVHSWAEREAAQGVVWSAPGVTTIVNDLIVEG
jgi:osmotically-inducible protein OsmY